MSLDFGPGDSDAAILFMGCMIGFSDVYNVWHDAKTAELTDITSVYTSVRLSIAITTGFIAFSRSISLLLGSRLEAFFVLAPRRARKACLRSEPSRPHDPTAS